ncbi:MAG: hypothetical protein AB200_00990 [Parcubacteria bacterium C7867-005]|nr:MAG: hypothetical protein AB200_00990 [Parcubacteria bacterium C7867-005]
MNPDLTTNQIIIEKANGKHEAFDTEKLRASLLRSGAMSESVEDVISKILPDLYNGMTTSEIYSHAFSLLHAKEKPVARRYSLRRAVMDLGPSGFPFEDFVAEILKAKGFETETRQSVLGGCVPHEVDVVAWNDKKLIMCEAKFHNQLGTKSDVKVALYVKARFDDLRENIFKYGGKERKINEGWLITNTKFSSTAIHYGECKDLVMIGWNYPEDGSLQDMIEEEKLHPITCLVSLSTVDKDTLLKEGIVLCTQIKQNPNLLEQALGAKVNIDEIISEINEL